MKSKPNPLAILNTERRTIEARLLALVLALLGGCACDAVALYVVWRLM